MNIAKLSAKVGNVKGLVAKVLTVGLLAGAVAMAAPQKAEAQEVYFQSGYGYAQDGYGRGGYYERERAEECRRQEEFARRQAWAREREFRHERWDRRDFDHDRFDRGRYDRDRYDRGGYRLFPTIVRGSLEVMGGARWEGHPVSCRTGPLRAGRSLRDLYTASRGAPVGRRKE